MGILLTLNILSTSIDSAKLNVMKTWTRHTSSPKWRTTVQKFVPCTITNTSNSFSLQEHLRAWLADPHGRDQYVTYRGDDVEIHWHGKPSQCEVAYAKKVRGCSTRFYASLHPLNILTELDRTLRVMVTSRHILRYAFPSGCPTVGWTVVGTSTSFCAPSCQV